MSDFNPYEVLGVEREADLATIKMAYRRLSKVHHPDVNGTGEDGQFKVIRDAWGLLSDPDAKAFFDQTGLVQKTAEDELRKEMINILTTSFDDVVGKLFEQGIAIKTYNVIGQMRHNMTDGMADILLKINIQKRQIDDLKEMKDMISVEGGGENVFAIRIEEMIDARQKVLVEFVNAHKIIDLALKEASKYSNIVQMMQGFWNVSSAPSNSTNSRF